MPRLPFWTPVPLVVPAALASNVIVIPPGSPPEALATAVTAAADGDAILVQAGTYYGFVADGKGLSIVADADAVVLVNGSAGVTNLPSSSDFLLAGLSVTGAWQNQDNPPATYTTGTAFYAFDCSGSVRVQGCTLTGGRADTDCMGVSAPGGRGANVRNSPDVAFAACTITGANGGGSTWGCWTGAGGMGGPALLSHASSVALYDCTLQAGHGGAQGERAGNGGHGVHLTGSGGVFLSNTPATGGNGGYGTGCDDPYNCCGAGEPGHGGHGVWMIDASSLQRLSSAFAGGIGGGSSCGWMGYGSPGAGLVDQSSGAVYEFAVPPRSTSALRVVREGQSLQITVLGVAGDLASLAVSRTTSFVALPSWRGVLLPGMNAPGRWMILGLVPASGELSASIPIAGLGPGVLGRTIHLQTMMVDANGQHVLGSHAAVLTLDGSL